VSALDTYGYSGWCEGADKYVNAIAFTDKDKYVNAIAFTDKVSL
jgi:hypothetical protein